MKINLLIKKQVLLVCYNKLGYILKDFEEKCEDIIIQDKLKAALLIEETEFYPIFSEDCRNEFLFHVFKRLVIGGSLCQWEDYVTEYLRITKLFYKGRKYK